MSAKAATFDVWVRQSGQHFVGWSKFRVEIASQEDALWLVGHLGSLGQTATVTETGKEPL
jgi:hypothetical protein